MSEQYLTKEELDMAKQMQFMPSGERPNGLVKGKQNSAMVVMESIGPDGEEEDPMVVNNAAGGSGEEAERRNSTEQRGRED